MVQKINKTSTAILLAIFPFVSIPFHNNFSPYIKGNPFNIYIAICIMVALVSLAIPRALAIDNTGYVISLVG